MLRPRSAKILKIILICVIALAGIEISIKLGFGFVEWLKNRNESKQLEAIQQAEEKAKVQPRVKANMPINGNDISLAVQDFFNKIYEGKINEAYNMLDPKFKEEFYNDFSTFGKYCKENYLSESGKIVEVKYHQLMGIDTYYCNIRIRDFEQTMEESVVLVEDMVVQYFNSDKDKYTLRMRGFVDSKEYSNTVTVGKVTLGLKKVYRLGDTARLTISVRNDESGPVSISREGIITKTKKFDGTQSDRTTEMGISGQSNDLIIMPGGTENFTLEYYLYRTAELTGIVFNSIKIGEENKTAEITISE